MRYVRYHVLTILLLVVSASSSFAQVEPGQSFTGKVTSVIDGDTYKVERPDGNGPVTVRLWGVDAPEPHQLYGEQARNAARRYIGGKTVHVRIKEVYPYGRPISKVTVSDRDLGQMLVQDGLAWHYDEYAPNAKQLARLERQARSAGRGLWTQDDPIPPWEWRDRNARPGNTGIRGDIAATRPSFNWKIQELTSSGEPIPKEYRSWSLFLICNPAWVVPEAETKLDALHERFQAFGRALGPENVAVWFWSQKLTPGTKVHNAVDVVRSSGFCSRLNLPPKEGPYVVVTTEYPGEGRVSSFPDTFRKLEDRFVLKLNGVEMSEAMEVLTSLARQIIAEKELSEVEVGSEGYWRKWQQIFGGLQAGFSDFSEKIKISINTQFFTVEMSSE